MKTISELFSRGIRTTNFFLIIKIPSEVISQNLGSIKRVKPQDKLLLLAELEIQNEVLIGTASSFKEGTIKSIIHQLLTYRA